MDWRHIEQLIVVDRELSSAMLNLVVWNKSTAGQGSFYRSQHELIGVFRVGRETHRNNIELGRFGRNRSPHWPPDRRRPAYHAVAASCYAPTAQRSGVQTARPDTSRTTRPRLDPPSARPSAWHADGRDHVAREATSRLSALQSAREREAPAAVASALDKLTTRPAGRRGRSRRSARCR